MHLTMASIEQKIAKNDFLEVELVKLLHSPAPEYYISAKKIFETKEEHVTRIYGRSVLILMLSGTLRFLEDGKKISLEAGEYYIQRQGLFQEGLPLSAPPTYYYIEFKGQFAEGGELALRGRFDRNLIEPIFLTLRSSENDFFRNAGMNEIFALLCRERADGSTAHKIRRFINSNYSAALTLETIAREFGYTEDYVTRLFKKEFGITPHKHLSNTRLEHALRLLNNTDLPVERVSEAVGYADFSSFWRAFKQKYSLSPGEIRKNRARGSVTRKA